MLKLLMVSTVCVSAALLFGFAGAAVMATNLGVAIGTAIGALLVLSCAFQGTQMFAQGGHASPLID